MFWERQETPTNTEKSPVTVDELQELIKLLAKYIATTKGANLQKTDATAHGLLQVVKWNKFQLGYCRWTSRADRGDTSDIVKFGIHLLLLVEFLG